MSRSPRDRHAIFAARFQPYHNGHHALIQQTLDEVDDPLLLAVVVSNRPALAADHGGERSEFEQIAAEHHHDDRNPWSAWDRAEAIRELWRDAPHASRVKVAMIPRPQGPPSWWEFVTSFLPRSRYWVLKWADEFEEAKRRFFLSMGEEIYVPTSARNPQVRGDEVRAAVMRREDLSRLVPTGIEERLIEPQHES